MKNLFVLLSLLLFVTSVSNAQKKNGTVYSEHELIDKTKAFWSALSNGEKDKVLSFFGDSVFIVLNGKTYPNSLNSQQLSGYVDSWLTIENLHVVNDKGASPDAVVYNNGSTWVYDWVRVKGEDSETGINIDIPQHNLFLFNKEGKIVTLYHYYDNAVFEEIANSKKTKENGKVYINHPFINKVRKLVNAYCKMDIDSILTFYAPGAAFTNSTMDWGKYENLDTAKKSLQDRFAKIDDIQMKQVGYPDCIYYEKNDSYTVYSWWIHSSKSKETGEIIEFPLMISMNFNKEGKITYQMEYYSSNHFE